MYVGGTCGSDVISSAADVLEEEEVYFNETHDSYKKPRQKIILVQ